MNEFQGIGLVGKVTVTSTKNSKVLHRVKAHNTITSRMSTGIAAMLCSNFLAKPANMIDYLPMYIGVGTGKTDQDNSDFDKNSLILEYTGSDGSGTSYRYKITSKELNLLKTETSNYSSVTFKTFISAEDLTDGYEVWELGLYADAEGNTLLSRVELSNVVQKRPGSGIDVQWSILIGPAKDMFSTEDDLIDANN